MQCLTSYTYASDHNNQHQDLVNEVNQWNLMQITFEKQELVPKTSDQWLLISDYSALLTNHQRDRCLLYVNMWIDSTIVAFIEWRCFHILI